MLRWHQYALIILVPTSQILQGQLEQDVDLSTLKGVQTQLSSPQLILHKDREVRASVACCIADVLRLSAPDAPYTGDDLQVSTPPCFLPPPGFHHTHASRFVASQDILQFFLMELCSPKSGLSNSSGPQYNDYRYLLDSLSRAKSIALVTDLPKADELMVDWFKRIFDIVR